MSKAKYTIFITLANIIGAVVYSVVLFLLASNKDNIFYISYGFTLVAFICFFISMLNVLIKPKNLDEAFLNEPYLSVSSLHLVAQFLFGIWAINFEGIGYKIVLSIDVLMFGIYAICALFLITGITMNKSIEKDLKDKKSFINELKNRLLTVNFEDKNTSDAFSKLLEDIKFSEPISENNVLKQEAEINTLAEELVNNSSDNIKACEQIKLIRKLIKERNIILKK